MKNLWVTSDDVVYIHTKIENVYSVYYSVCYLVCYYVFYFVRYSVFHFLCYFPCNFNNDVISKYMSGHGPRDPHRFKEVFLNYSDFPERLWENVAPFTRIGNDAHSAIDQLPTLMKASSPIIARGLGTFLIRNYVKHAILQLKSREHYS